MGVFSVAQKTVIIQKLKMDDDRSIRAKIDWLRLFYSSHFLGLGCVNCRTVYWCVSYRLNLDVYNSGWRPLTNLKVWWGLPLAPSSANHVPWSADDPSNFGLMDYWVSIGGLGSIFHEICPPKDDLLDFVCHRSETEITLCMRFVNTGVNFPSSLSEWPNWSCFGEHLSPIVLQLKTTMLTDKNMTLQTSL